MTDTTQAAPALKEIFDRARLKYFASETKAIWPPFDEKRFVALATDGLDDLGIMQRMRLAAEAFGATLPQDFGKAVDILADLAPRIRHGFASITLSEFVALYGQKHFDRSMAALKLFTTYGSAEFAIRHFLAADFDRTLAVMRGWAEDDNEHVRRLASEGSRPRLPWSFQLKNLIADPSPTLPILERLKADDALYVRKSVANHLNDIGKDHPDVLVDTVSRWDRADPRTGWIVRHALRTLVKKGDARALAIVGASGEADIRVNRFAVTPAKVRLGDRIAIEGEIVSTGAGPQRLVVDYAVHYVKKLGKTSRKVFKLKELSLSPDEAARLSISQMIRDFTTRTHQPGHHAVELLVNGQALARSGFEIVA
ncbi:MAG: DNA alkylation repair protein [Rhizobiaceae bacterium]|nr:DNA alkylation repair protein [Rhizobiaceae bacterium]